jgi:hypothetical protein
MSNRSRRSPLGPATGLSRWAILIPLSYMAGIHWLSSVPGEVPPESPLLVELLFVWTPPAVQNLLHIPLYGGLALAWRWSLGGWMRRASHLTLTAFVLTVGYGVIDEWYQLSVPGRYGSMTDVLLNTVGAIAALWLYARFGVSSLERTEAKAARGAEKY